MAADAPPHARPIWLVGCGNMGRALLDRWLASGLAEGGVVVIDPSPAQQPDRGARPGLWVVAAPSEAPAPPGVVVLAVKPQQLDSAAEQLAPCLPPAVPLLSILAGTSLRSLSRRFPTADVVRAMPNTPARIGRGVTALFASGAGNEARRRAEALAGAAGRVLWLDREELFDAVTAVSGSGPAYLFHFLEALGTAGEAVGLPAELSRLLALETVAGASELAARSGEPPDELRRQVTSPNGTTAAALRELMPHLPPLMARAVAAAAKRSAELAAEADGGEVGG